MRLLNALVLVSLLGVGCTVTTSSSTGGAGGSSGNQAGTGAGGHAGSPGAGGAGSPGAGGAGSPGAGGAGSPGAGGNAAGGSVPGGGMGGATSAGGAGVGGSGVDACGAGRSTGDRPDDSEGYQIRINYVIPADGVDEMLDTSGKLAASVTSFTSWFQAQTGGPRLRVDTCGGAPDIRFFRTTQTEAELTSKGLFLRDAIEAELKAAGLMHPEKIEAVFYGGDADSVCGGGAWPPALIGRVAAVYLKGTFADPNIPPCGSNPLGASLTQPGYLDFSMLHEIMHTIGVVPTCAPHQVKSGHVSDSPNDLMYAGDLPWLPTTLDLNHDDYFQANLAGCPDLSRSVFLDPLPDGAQTPPGW